MDIRPLSATVSTLPRGVTPEDIPYLADAGYKRVINNRPDEEVGPEAGGTAIEAACKAAGIDYVALPLRPGQLTPELVKAFGDALRDGQSVIAYCRTGNRSATLWALSQAQLRPAEDLVEAARAAGYDLSGALPLIQQYAAAETS